MALFFLLVGLEIKWKILVGERSSPHDAALPYILAGITRRYLTLLSDLHATVAGILLALTIPARLAFSPGQFSQRLQELGQGFHAAVLDPEAPDHPPSNHRMATIAENVERASKTAQPPLQRMEHGLSTWVIFMIIPIFALANAGIDFSRIDFATSISAPVTLARHVRPGGGEIHRHQRRRLADPETGLGKEAARHELALFWIGQSQGKIVAHLK
ncbi:MAG: Na+/H+ antiporter NhaA [Gammaproteobacteria bacterium]|nr:Na+/H+ antiporter NhaA [Gammaproteobacteria bacterium]MBU1731065.1 Na+/H+ antiporter NhaA [Gammaproteobacteria bacterium]MBU1894129.1 Na+/H+ antiporter NhaA [Gammaproteobacteria bacterium]